MKTFLTQLFFFGSVQVLGLIAALRIKNVIPEFIVEPQKLGVVDIILYIALATVFFLVLVRMKSKIFRGKIIRGLFWLTLAVGLLVFWESFFSSVIALAIASLMVIWRYSKPNILNHNILIGLSSAGVGAVLGVGLTPKQAIIILVIISIYDFIAVYKTKHMVKMAETMIEEQAVIALILPESGKSFKASPGGFQPGQGFMVLGAGDLVFPLLMTVSTATVSLFGGVVVLVFSFLGFLLLHIIFHSQKKRRAMPALPPLALAVIVGYLASIVLGA